MKMRTRALLVLAGSTLAAMMAAPAFAEGAGCDPEVSVCGPPPPPPKPNMPAAVSTNGDYNVSIGTIANNNLQNGYYRDGQTTYFGGGPFHPIGGDGVTLTVGDSDNYISMAPTLSPLGAVSVTAVALTPQDTTFPGFDKVARGDLTLAYVVDIHASDAAAASALSSLLSTSGAIASIGGSFSLTATDSSWGSVSARTGTNELASGLQGVFGQSCSPIGYFGTPGGCSGGTYSLPLNFVSGSKYSDGDPLDFISMIQLSASANAGPPDLGYAPGTMTAYIDPTITWNPNINLSNYSVTVGSFSPPQGGVPEPASWAMLLTGVGLLGAGMRRRRSACQVTA